MSDFVILYRCSATQAAINEIESKKNKVFMFYKDCTFQGWTISFFNSISLILQGFLFI